MTIEQELSIIKDNIAEYGQTNITQDEYNMICNKAVNDICDKFADLIREDFNITLDVVMDVRKEFMGKC